MEMAVVDTPPTAPLFLARIHNFANAHPNWSPNRPCSDRQLFLIRGVSNGFERPCFPLVRVPPKLSPHPQVSARAGHCL